LEPIYSALGAYLLHYLHLEPIYSALGAYLLHYLHLEPIYSALGAYLLHYLHLEPIYSALGAYLLHYLHLEPISTLCILSLLTRNQLYAESRPPRLRRLLVDEIQVGCGENNINNNKNKSEQVKKCIDMDLDGSLSLH
jgi:hypothetical protein